MFDTDTFLNTTTSEANETVYSPVPEGEYNAVVEDVKGRETANGTPIMDVSWRTDAPGNDEAHDRVIRQSIFLDMSEGGALLTGKNQNVQLGRLRDALGQNKPGQPWSPSMLIGAVARVSVKHRLGEPDEEGNAPVFADVKGVTKAA